MTSARWYYEGRRATPNLVVIHSLEYPEKVTSAEDALRYFETTDRKASVHAVADSDSVTRPVDDEDTAFGAAGVNSRALHIEHAGYAAQTEPEWVDPYGLLMLPRSAKQVAAWCRKYAIPPVRLTVEQVRAGVPGICSHYDVSRAFPDVSTGHTDPGTGFPWDYYLGLVRAQLEDDMTRAEFDDAIKAACEKGGPIYNLYHALMYGKFYGSTGADPARTGLNELKAQVDGLPAAVAALIPPTAGTPGLPTGSFPGTVTITVEQAP